MSSSHPKFVPCSHDPPAGAISRNSSETSRGPPIRSPSSSRLIEPERVLPHDVVYAEIVVGIMPFNIVVPDVVDLFPGDRQYRRVLFHDSFGLADQCQALGRIDLAVD